MKTINETELVKYIYNKTEIEPDTIKKVLDTELDYLKSVRLVTYRKTNIVQDFIDEIILLYKQYKSKKTINN